MLHSSQDGIFAGVVRAILGWNLEHRRDGLRVLVDEVSDHLGDVLADEYDCYVFPRRQILERILNGLLCRLCYFFYFVLHV